MLCKICKSEVTGRKTGICKCSGESELTAQRQCQSILLAEKLNTIQIPRSGMISSYHMVMWGSF